MVKLDQMLDGSKGGVTQNWWIFQKENRKGRMREESTGNWMAFHEANHSVAVFLKR